MSNANTMNDGMLSAEIEQVVKDSESNREKIMKNYRKANSRIDALIKLREKLTDDSIFIDKVEFLEFSEDFLFSSPSAAAAIVMGRSANGLTEWKLTSGKTLKEFETNQN